MNKVYVLIHGMGYEACYVEVEVFDSRKNANKRAREIAEQRYKENFEDNGEELNDKLVAKIPMKKLMKRLWPDSFWHEIKMKKVQG